MCDKRGLGQAPERRRIADRDTELGNGSADAARFSAAVEVVEYLGDEQLVHLRSRDTPLLAKLPIELGVQPGEEREFAIPRDKLYVFDAESERAISV